MTSPTSIPSLLCFWNFQEPPGSRRIGQGSYAYALHEAAGPISTIDDGIFGPVSAELKAGQWFEIPRADCPGLDVHGPDAQITVVAWLRRHRKREVQCEAIAGMWDETRQKRQYALFLDLRIHQASDNVAGHVSGNGGPTIGYPWCMDAAVGASYLTYFDWHCVAFSYDGKMARAYLDGELDRRVGFNPYAYPNGLFDAGPSGSDFTVGAVHRGGSMGNWFAGRIGGLAVFNRALSNDEQRALADLLPEPRRPSPTKPPILV